MTRTKSRRGLLFMLLVAACVLVTAVAVISGVRGSDEGPQGSARAHAALSAARTEDRPAVLMRVAEGDEAVDSGLVAVAGARAPTSRVPASLRCDRAHFAGGRGICLAAGGGFAAGYRARVFGADFKVRHDVEVAGIPSRARVSPDGRYGTVTLFVTGHSYAAEGAFSTETTLIDLARGERIAELEDFTVTRAGRQVTAVDVNFWGVTFARDSDRFYATMATGGETYLIAGSVRARTAHVIHENVECPSLSPDGRRIAYKSRTGSSERPWRLTVLDLSTMRETPLAEPQSVDDQAEWLDDEHVLYGIEDQIRVVRADGTGRSRTFARAASSPAVARW